jgi:hypothetical protein
MNRRVDWRKHIVLVSPWQPLAGLECRGDDMYNSVAGGYLIFRGKWPVSFLLFCALNRIASNSMRSSQG